MQMHFCVLLWGVTAIIGKAITLPAFPLVWWRMTLVTLALLLSKRFRAGVVRIPLRLAAIYAGIGVIVAMHWLAFYGSVKLSNASVAATCMALAPVFTAFVEPLFVGRRFESREFLFGLAVIPGAALVAGGTPPRMYGGLAAGVLAAFLVAVFGSLNKRYVEGADALSVTGLEMAAGAAAIAAIGPFVPQSEPVFVMPEAGDAVLLLVLAIACTLLPYALSLVALRRLSAFSSALAVNMEPVYAIVLAILFFGEHRDLGVRFYAGLAIILATVFAHPLLGPRAIPAPTLQR